MPTQRTLAQVEKAIRDYHAEHGKCPILSTEDCEFTGESMEKWLRRYQKTSLHRYCVSLGLKKPIARRTLDKFDAEARAYFAKHGEIPDGRSNANGFDGMAWNLYLRQKHGMTLIDRCIEPGLRPPKVKRTLALFDQLAREFKDKHGRAPTNRDRAPEFEGDCWNQWLWHTRKSSVHRRCVAINLTPAIRTRSLDRFDREAFLFFDEHGKAPRSTTKPPLFEGNAWNLWLARVHDTSVYRRCLEIGLCVKGKRNIDKPVNTAPISGVISF